MVNRYFWLSFWLSWAAIMAVLGFSMLAFGSLYLKSQTWVMLSFFPIMASILGMFIAEGFHG